MRIKHTLTLSASIAMLAFALFACKEEGKKQTESNEVSVSATEIEEELAEEVIVGTFTDSRDGKNYKTVKIGKHIWMAENLNYDVAGSKCYDNKPENCQKYGRLYNWKTAKKACPSDWHIPSNADWNILMKIANPSCSDNNSCNKAGTKLKATSGWDEGNGTDNYSFAALPGGSGNSEGEFVNVGIYSGLWSSSESSASNAYSRGMYFNFDYVSWDDDDKSSLNSVRCVQD